jgi:hypothetical protein
MVLKSGGSSPVRRIASSQLLSNALMRPVSSFEVVGGRIFCSVSRYCLRRSSAASEAADAIAELNRTNSVVPMA